jgi:uncharacterized membrane protein YccC
MPAWNFVRRALTQYDQSKVSIARGVRNSLGVAIPLAVGALTGRIEPALVAATGALNVGFADSTERWEPRGRQMLAACGLVTAAVVCGALSGWSFAAALVSAMVWAFAMGMLVSLGVQAGNLGVSSIAVLLIFAAHPLGLKDALLSGLLALGGGLLQTVISILPWPQRGIEPERAALAALYLELAKPLKENGSPAASASVNRAGDALAATDQHRTLTTARYRALLDQAERIRASLVTLNALRVRIDPAKGPENLAQILDQYVAAAGVVLATTASALRNGNLATVQPAPVEEVNNLLDTLRALPHGAGQDALLADILTQTDALARQLRVTLDLASRATRLGVRAYAQKEAALPWKLRVGGTFGTLFANMNLKSTAFRHAIRLSVAVGAADCIGRLAGWDRPYWFPLTVAVVLKPDFSSTFSRGILRLAGTFTGLLLATELFHILPQNVWVDIALIAIVTFVLRWTGPAHYGVLAMTVSQLVVLLVALTGVLPRAVILARARNTALGGSLALAVYWLWPTWERTRAGDFFARMLDAYRVHFELITRAFASPPSAAENAAMDRTRRASRLARANFEASVDRLSGEPGTRAEEREWWNSILVNSYIFVHAMITFHASLLASGDGLIHLGKAPAFRDFAGGICATLDSLAKIARGETPQSFPNLRDAHYRLVNSGEPMAARHTLVAVESDKMVNSLNTLHERLTQGVINKSENVRSKSQTPC